jgi:hypothetical protein
MKLLTVQLPSPVTSSLFGPDIILTTLFSNVLSLCSSLNEKYNFRTVALYTLTFLW